MDAPVASPDGGRPLRKDAERNRRRILEAAREVFSQRGLEVTLDDIGRHAGVGVGTVYRRFPNKEVLVEELFEEQIHHIVSLAERALQHDDPWEGLSRFLTTAIETMAWDRGLRQVMLTGNYGRDRVARARDRLVPVMISLVHRAQKAGTLRPEIEATDLPLIEHMMGAIVDYTQTVRPDAWRRYLTIILDGLRARPEATPLEVPPLASSEMDRLMGLDSSHR